MKEPFVLIANSQNETAASGSPSIGSSMVLTGMDGGRTRTADWKSSTRSSLETCWMPVAAKSWVGRPSVIRMMLSGNGFSSFGTLNARCRLVPPSGTRLPRLFRAPCRSDWLSELSQRPSVPSRTGSGTGAECVDLKLCPRSQICN